MPLTTVATTADAELSRTRTTTRDHLAVVLRSLYCDSEDPVTDAEWFTHADVLMVLVDQYAQTRDAALRAAPTTRDELAEFEQDLAAAGPAPLPQLRPEPRSMAHEDKLYLVTRADLSAGYQITQTVHAAADFCFAHPEHAARWHDVSNSVIVLTVPDERALHALTDKAAARGIELTTFREPDLGDELTAVALAPSAATRKLCSNLPLAGRRLADQEALVAREQRLRSLSFAMMDCEQTKGQDVLAHGRSVREHYRVLAAHLRGQADLGAAPNWRLPSWLQAYRPQLAAALPDDYVMDRYLTLHDCGKPSVRTVDEGGRAHFPGHADASARVYQEVFAEDADPLVADLIAHDMDVHLLKAADVPEFAARPTAIAHLLAGLAEITSNAAMFGGVDSVGYKIKAKHLEQRGRAICRALFGEPQVSA